jgi:hypothetical protein
MLAVEPHASGSIVQQDDVEWTAVLGERLEFVARVVGLRCVGRATAAATPPMRVRRVDDTNLTLWHLPAGRCGPST